MNPPVPDPRFARRSQSLLALAFSALFAIALVACNERQAKPIAATDSLARDDHDDESAHANEVVLTPQAIAQYGVKVDNARLRTLRPTFIAPARIAFDAEAMAHVGSPVRGRAVQIDVRLGDSVQAGQPLLVIESPELGEAQADLLQKQLAALSSGPAAELAKASWVRAQNLLDQSQGISLTEVQRREAEYRVAAASQKAAQAAAIAAESRLRLLGMTQEAIASLAKSGEIVPRYTVRSPIDGAVVQRELTLGEIVSPDRESLMVIADTRKLWILADVPESKLSGLDRGTKAWISINSNTKLDASVAFVSPIIDPATRTAQVRIEVPATTAQGIALRPGMFAQVEFEQASDSKPVVAVPAEAIQTVEGKTAVFIPVDDEPNTFAKRAVVMGKPVGLFVPILSGLADGEPFVSSGTFILKAELGKAGASHEH